MTTSPPESGPAGRFRPAAASFRVHAAGVRLAACALALGIVACGKSPAPPEQPDPFRAARERMVAEQLTGPGRDIDHRPTLAAMAAVPRHAFVPERLRAHAYTDAPLPIGYGQTISQPFIVAFMTAALDPRPGEKILEIGTGSGYQAAVLAAMQAEVFSIEIIEPLGRAAEKTLRELGYGQVRVRIGDGYAGWPEEAPFDAIIVTCAPEAVPQPLIDQLKPGGRMIIPVGGAFAQELVLLAKTGDGLQRRRVLPVRFVPMTGKAQEPGR